MSLIKKIDIHPTGVNVLFFEGRILSDAHISEVVTTVQEKLDFDNKQFVAELSALEYINSTGLNLFLKLFSKIRSRGGELVFANVSEGVEKLFSISKLDSIFKICASEEEALTYLKLQK